MALTLTPSSTQGEVTAKMVLLGLGLGPTVPLYTIAIQNAVALPQLGVATSMVTFFRQMGSTVGLALVGSLFGATLAHELDARTAAATKDLPPAWAERFRTGPTGAPGEGGPTQGRFDADQVKPRVGGQLEGATSVAKRALAGDAIAIALVASSPLADERLRAVAANGGVKAQVSRSFEAMRARVTRASESPQAWAALQGSSELSPAVQQQVRQVPAALMAAPEQRMATVRSVLAVVDAVQAQAEQRALAQAVTEVNLGTEAVKARLFAAIDAVGQAMKASFTEAVCLVFLVALGLALVAFALTAMLPQLPLRASSSPPPPVAE